MGSDPLPNYEASVDLFDSLEAVRVPLGTAPDTGGRWQESHTDYCDFRARPRGTV
jgi:hypothetical protein